MSIAKNAAALTVAALLAIAAAMIGCSGKDENGDKEESPGYLKSLMIARKRADETLCQTNLRDIHSALRLYAMTEEQFPPRLVRLSKWEGMSLPAQKLHCPSGTRREYEYIPDQDASMPADNILVYEAEAAHAGRCYVLRISGKIEKLTPAELEAAVAATKRRIAQR